MALLVICLFAVLALGQIALYVRLSPLQTFQDERTARQGAQGRSRTAVITEGQSLLNGLRNQHKDSAEIVRHEHRISVALCDQRNAERVASQALCAQLNAARVASEELCLQLNAERVDLLDTLYRAFGPARVDQAVEEIKYRRAQRLVHAQQAHAQSEQPAAPAGEESPERARPTTLPSTPEEVEEQRKLVAATAAGDVDPEDTTATHALSKAALATALEVEAGGATLAPRGVPRALHAGSVAPPASAPPPLPSEPAQKAAGLGRPHSPHGARPLAPLRRTETITGMPALQSQAPTERTLPERSSGATRKQSGTDRSMPTPAGSAQRSAVSAFAMTQASMQAQVAAPTSLSRASVTSFFEDETDEERESKRDTETNLPPRAPKPGNDDGEATEVITMDPKALQNALRPTAQEGLRGMEGIPEAAPGRQRGYAEETSRKSRLTVLEAGK